MKYIRINDKIYETKNFRLVEDERFGRRYVNKYNFPFIPNKEANTIEELVDGYYLDIDNHPFDSTQIYDKDELQKVLNEKEDWQSYSDRKYLEYEINLYAFIKADNGLRYVAKMNDKGELELL